MTEVAIRPAVSNNPLYDPADQYAVQIVGGPHADDPDVPAEFAICAPIEKLDRKLRPGDWVHARLHKLGLVCDVVRKVVARKGHLSLEALTTDVVIKHIPIDDEVEIRGLVLQHQQDRRT